MKIFAPGFTISATKTSIALLLATVCCGASAQDQIPASFRGAWKTSWKQPTQAVLKQFEARLVLAESGGTWSLNGYFPNSSHYACDNRIRTTVTVQSSSPEEVVVKINNSAAVNGCTDEKMTLKRVGEKNLGGKLGDTDVVFAPD